MTNYIAVIRFTTTDKPPTENMERLVSNIVDGHGLEITDVHVETEELDNGTITSDAYSVQMRIHWLAFAALQALRNC